MIVPLGESVVVVVVVVDIDIVVVYTVDRIVPEMDRGVGLGCG